MNDKIKKSLEAVSIEDLKALIAEKEQAAYQPLVDEYEETAEQLNDLRERIQKINPKWQPKTLGERIIGFVGADSDSVTDDEITAEFPKVQSQYIKNTVKKLLKDGKIVLKDGKYSLPAEDKK